MPRGSVGRPVGSQNLPLQQAVVANFPLYVTLAPGPVPFIQDVDLMEVLGAPLAAANPVISGIYDALGNRMPAMDAAARPGYVDVIDRAGRLVGIIYGDLGQLHQVVPADALAPGNTIAAANFNFVYNGATWDMVREGSVAGSILTDVVDRAARLLGVVYGDLAQLQQIAAPGDALVPANTLESTGLLYVYNGATWDRVHEGAVAGSILTDPADRAGRLVGIVYGSLAQIQQLAALGDGVTPSNTLESTGMLYVYNGATWDMVREGATAGSIIVEDTGLNTNPRRFESDNGFWSAPTAVVGPAATALWTIATTPARTAGLETTIYTIEIENSTGAAVTAWLEIGGVVITVPFHIVDNDSITIPYVAGFATGNNDVNCNASAVGVVVSIKGTEL